MDRSADTLEKARKIKYLVLDVDGVLTDGRIFFDGKGGEWKAFDVRDGHRIVLARREGLKVVFMTGRESEAVRQRAEELAVHRLFQGARDKGRLMERLLAEEGVAAEEVAFLGDDLVDLPAMGIAGLAAAVADAAPEVRSAAQWVSSQSGGRGAVGEFVEYILKAQGLWESVLAGYGA